MFPLQSPSHATHNEHVESHVDDAVLRGAVFERRMADPEVRVFFVFVLYILLNTTERPQLPKAVLFSPPTCCTQCCSSSSSALSDAAY